MEYVNLKQMQTVEERLSEQIATLRLLREEILQTERNIKHMAYMDKTRTALVKSREALDENIRVLSSMKEVICVVCLEYRRMDERIADCYNLDIVVYPETRFGTSRITGMEEYQSLMPF